MNKRSASTGGGILVAIGAIAGSVGGLYSGQPSVGLIVGVAAGTAAAVLIWLKERR
ncbi:MAG: hypothetical protein WC816_13225 [Sphingomonas sp.]|jgi:uncharacterized protein YqgC (DUF456 family)